MICLVLEETYFSMTEVFIARALNPITIDCTTFLITVKVAIFAGNFRNMPFFAKIFPTGK